MSRGLTRHEVLELLQVREDFLALLEHERLVEQAGDGSYAQRTLERIRLCSSLHDELGVNVAGIEVALHLLDRIQRERRQFREVLGWLERELAE